MYLDFNRYSYPSRRTVTFGYNGMTATGSTFAATAGMEMLQKGGNCIDAIVAMAMTLPVVEPTANGIGGDAFAIAHVNGKLYGLNASGWSSKNISAKVLRDKGMEEIPTYGLEAVNLPGAPAAWAELMNKFGKLSFEEVAAPAIKYAEEGFPVSVNVANGWKGTYNNLSKNHNDELYAGWFKTFGSEPPKPGDMRSYKYMGATLREIAKTNAKSFYEGDLMEKMVKFMEKHGGYLDKSDFMEYKPEWVDPVSSNYKGYDVCELPPNGNGITALMALNILSNFELDPVRESARNYHLQMEAMKLAYADAHKYIAEPSAMTVSVKDLISKEYGRMRAKEILEDRAQVFGFGDPKASGTVYLCAADKDGNMVSYIQSNYMGFGSGIVVDGTDISLHNRGHNFTMEDGHANQLAPRKRSFHTIIPGFLMKDGKAIGPFGVMGGFMQPQGHLQMMVNTIDFHMNPQDSLDATRFQWHKGLEVQLESTVGDGIAHKLSEMGHKINMTYNQAVGRGQIIWRLENGMLAGGTEPRTDGMVAAW
ncbi:MAG: gamma-glutamyltransferase family protein [Defluviitaleaceae bacterium]|nr:gamma-glutamyltransferase family protein [Defluviitaleaceae bacterium]